MSAGSGIEAMERAKAVVSDADNATTAPTRSVVDSSRTFASAAVTPVAIRLAPSKVPVLAGAVLTVSRRAVASGMQVAWRSAAS